MNRPLISATILSLCLWATGCKNDNKDTEPSGHHKMADQNMQMATAMIEPTKGNSAKGTVTFTQMGDKVHVVADISGLAPNSKHGFHIHEGTECGDDGMLAKGHYNPEQHQHGLPNASPSMRHAGDFGNIEADGSGKAHLDMTFDNITISGQKNPIVGHALIVHANPDDGSQPTGNAGARIGCGIIKAGGAARAINQDNTNDLRAEPAIRLVQTGLRSTFSEFKICPACTTPDFSKEINTVYHDAGVAHEVKDSAFDNQNKYTIVMGSAGFVVIDNDRVEHRLTLSGISATTKSGGGK